jgi:hypothetical protein
MLPQLHDCLLRVKAPLGCAAVSVLFALGLPPVAGANVANVVDPQGDTPNSFDLDKADVTRVAVEWADRLEVRVTYASVPSSRWFSVMVSSAAEDPLDPGVRECADTDDMLSVTSEGDSGSARLVVRGIEGSLTAEPAWSQTTATYVFSSPSLTRQFSASNPFVCVSGSTNDDTFFGAFDGMVLKLTGAVARQAVRGELSERWAVGSSSRTKVRCLDRGKREVDDGYDMPQRWCGFQAVTGRSVKFGSASVYLEAGDPAIEHFSSAAFPRGTKECGTTDFSSQGWLLPPFPPNFGGAFLSAWGKNVSCRTARRVVRSRRASAAAGFRCVATKRGWEYVKGRCKARGGRVVWYETGV